METEADNKIPFLDVHVIRKQSSIITTIYRKPTHTGRYLNFHSNHPPHVKRGIIRNLYNKAKKRICPHGLHGKPDQPTQLGIPLHLDPSGQKGGQYPTEKELPLALPF
jgi:hypothetical protein